MFHREQSADQDQDRRNLVAGAGHIAADVAGIQNVWIRGAGCAPGVANFSS